MKKERFCTKCGTRIIDGQSFCAKCGRDSSQDLEAIKKTVGEKIVAFFKALPSLIGGAIVIALLIWGVLFGIRCYDMDGKAIGVWESEKSYLSSYDAEITSRLTVNEDGSWVRVGYITKTGVQAFEQTGSWSISGATVVLAQPEQTGVMIYEYHLNGTLTNGDIEYVKK